MKKSRYLYNRGKNASRLSLFSLTKHTHIKMHLYYHYFTNINNTKNSSTVKCRRISYLLICKHKLTIYITCLWPSCKIKDIKRNPALDCSVAFLMRIRTNVYVMKVTAFSITSCKHLNRYFLPTSKYLKS